MADDTGRINQVLAETSFLYGGNLAYVEDLYARYAVDPTSVPPTWRAFFDALRESPEAISRFSADPDWSYPPKTEERPEWLSAIDGQWPDAVGAKAGTVSYTHLTLPTKRIV